MTASNITFIDNSRLMTESFVQAGADVFIGYPITPANLLYLYASKRYPVFLAAPDEITTLQWMCGFATTGHIPVTATSFPGYALMIESINMAYMMELPMVIVLVQRLGPATGTATCGAQGDLSVVTGTISGGLAIPVISTSDAIDCWEMPALAVETAVKLRTPVILLTSKEEVMTVGSLDISTLNKIQKQEIKQFKSKEKFRPYQADKEFIPPYLPVTNNQHQVRFTASTHDQDGILQNTTPEALNNSKRLHQKVMKHMDALTFFDYTNAGGAETLVVSYGVTAQAAFEAVEELNKKGKKVSLLIAKTLYPVPEVYFNIISGYKKVVFAEENLTGQFRQLMFGQNQPAHIKGVNEFGKMITPSQIIEEVLRHE